MSSALNSCLIASARKTCAYCERTGTDSKLRKCFGCLQALYCNEDHQRLDWNNHKRYCFRHPCYIWQKGPYFMVSRSVCNAAPNVLSDCPDPTGFYDVYRLLTEGPDAHALLVRMFQINCVVASSRRMKATLPVPDATIDEWVRQGDPRLLLFLWSLHIDDRREKINTLLTRHPFSTILYIEGSRACVSCLATNTSDNVFEQSSQCAYYYFLAQDLFRLSVCCIEQSNQHDASMHGHFKEWFYKWADCSRWILDLYQVPDSAQSTKHTSTVLLEYIQKLDTCRKGFTAGFKLAQQQLSKLEDACSAQFPNPSWLGLAQAVRTFGVDKTIPKDQWQERMHDELAQIKRHKPELLKMSQPIQTRLKQIAKTGSSETGEVLSFRCIEETIQLKNLLLTLDDRT